MLIPLQPYDRVCELTSTTGTGTVALDGVPSASFFTFLSTIGVNGICQYVISSQDGSQSEWGEGEALSSPARLQRNKVLGGSNGRELVDFSAGVKNVRLTMPAEWLQTVPLTPQMFGAVGDGDSHPLSGIYDTLAEAQIYYSFATALTDELDYCGIQKAINTARYLEAAVSGRYLGMTISIPAGIYRINKTVEIEEVRSLAIEGVNGLPVIKWYGDSVSPMFLAGNCESCRLENVWLLHGSSTANSVLSAFDLQNGGASSWTPTDWLFCYVRIGGFNNGTFQYGMRVLGNGTGGDANNENHKWEHCVFNSHSEAGLLIQSATQAHNLTLEDCEIRADSAGKSGIRVAGASALRLSVLRCGGGAHTEYDFDYRATALQSIIDGWNSENSARLCQWGTGPTGTPAQLTIQNCRWESPSNIAADGLIVKGWGPGPLVFVNNGILANVVGSQPKVFWDGPDSLGKGFVIFEGNRFEDQAQDYTADALSVTDTIVRKFGNTYWSDALQAYVSFDDNETVAAAGTNQGTAAVLGDIVTTVTGADGSNGVILPVPVFLLQELTVYSSTATNGLNVYPHVGGDINDGGINSAIVIEGKTMATFINLDGTTWMAMYTANT